MDIIYMGLLLLLFFKYMHLYKHFDIYIYLDSCVYVYIYTYAYLCMNIFMYTYLYSLLFAAKKPESSANPLAGCLSRQALRASLDQDRQSSFFFPQQACESLKLEWA